MASSNDNVSMALFCDFENVALGVRDANYDKFDIKPVLERLLLKGSIVVKKAYCDWDRYKSFKASMHEANFELIEIPHVRQSGKNSADIRMVVDALDLCYTKSHVDTFVIISGDSDFSPLVSKLRENAKKVIGVGVKQSTSDLLVANCDEFIFYDDLVRESRRARRESSNDKPQVKRSPEEERARRDEMEKRRTQAVEIAVNTFEALVLERGDSGKIWASVLKEAIKRRKPDFSESYYGFRTFGNLIEECKARGLLEFGRDEKSGAYVYRGNGVPSASVPLAGEQAAGADGVAAAAPAEGGQQESRRSRNRGRTAAERFAERQAQRLAHPPRAVPAEGVSSEAVAPAEEVVVAVADSAPVVLEAAVDLPSSDAVAPAKKKNGTKPPARKMKNAAKKGKGAADEAPAAVAPRAADAPAEVAPAPSAPVVAAPVVEAPAVAAPVSAEAPAVNAKPGKSTQGKPKAKPKAKAKPAGDADAGTANAKPKAANPANVANANANAANANSNAGAANAAGAGAGKPAKPARKPAARTPRPPKPVAATEE
ncbi:NYN domain-containing protein [Duganella sp. FT80W]|uniref:NYN domain-containing protein n=1 Tax=Duganella guangzhouensis TaxID=2666084 RepID=A0A6I2L7D3_9BURK|nr:NYN domain-containing protein [Duganella guangzhouensis]MRW93743.1 NYN domain-containing protein [Duganella guangzhouensis]